MHESFDWLVVDQGFTVYGNLLHTTFVADKKGHGEVYHRQY
jgi:hypothetical protein